MKKYFLRLFSASHNPCLILHISDASHRWSCGFRHRNVDESQEVRQPPSPHQESVWRPQTGGQRVRRSCHIRKTSYIFQVIARLLKTRDSGHKQALESYIVEDLKIMSDFEINKTCETYRVRIRFISIWFREIMLTIFQCIEHLSLGNHIIAESGKFRLLDDMLPMMQSNGDRVLIFSQFTMMMDVMEKFLKIRGHRYLRLDGQTPVQERQYLIDEFNNDPEIFIFILSTRAGGLGINLTAANTVILHDLDFNPYNDKQAEDRCHRMGQTKEVKIIRSILILI